MKTQANLSLSSEKYRILKEKADSLDLPLASYLKTLIFQNLKSEVQTKV